MKEKTKEQIEKLNENIKLRLELNLKMIEYYTKCIKEKKRIFQSCFLCCGYETCDPCYAKGCTSSKTLKFIHEKISRGGEILPEEMKYFRARRRFHKRVCLLLESNKDVSDILPEIKRLDIRIAKQYKIYKDE